MPKIKFVDLDGGGVQEVMAAVGTSIMQAAVESGVDGILGDCGGTCSCATCHCYIRDEWSLLVGPPGEMEAELLTCVHEPSDQSRLACQIIVVDSMDGLEVIIPAMQL